MIEYMQKNDMSLGINIEETIKIIKEINHKKNIQIANIEKFEDKYRKCKSFFKKHGIPYNKKNRLIFFDLKVCKIIHHNEMRINEEEAIEFLHLFEYAK